MPDRVQLSFVIVDIQAERQSAMMSKISYHGITRSGTGCSVAVPSLWQLWASKG